MKTGDLVRLRDHIQSDDALLKKDLVGIVIKVQEPILALGPWCPPGPVTADCGSKECGIAHIKFPHHTFITCRWEELEVIGDLID